MPASRWGPESLREDSSIRTISQQPSAQRSRKMHEVPAFAAHRRMWRRNITVISLFCHAFSQSQCGHNQR
jgi:hypothetical protein